ncbi:MAG: hypothetical protein EOP87_01225 [Verrucomicrobiaceae bacterium]|nr:MAG: hypothetical protein EOP87_01225 [Verrucomicrobiaceae bacterium]
MKPGTTLPPLVVAIGGAIWLGSQTATISRIETENKDLGSRISAQRSRPGEAGIDRPSPAPERTRAAVKKGGPKDEPLNWKELAGKVGEMQRGGGMGDMKSMIRFQQRLQQMSAEELVEALDEIAALDLPEQERMMLEQMLAGPLAQKDPELALNRFLDRLDDRNGIWGWQLSSAVKQWAEKDPAAATAWFDGQIAAGKFDSKALSGKSQARTQFEGALLSRLVSSDPEEASRRLSKLPEEQRGEILKHHEFSNLKEADHSAFAKLVREQVSEKERPDALGQPAAKLASEKGYAEVTAYMERVQATEAERAAIVTRAAQGRLSTLNHSAPVTSTQIDEMRTWAAAQAPGSEDKATGRALADMAGFENQKQFANAAKLAGQYHGSTGNDEILTTFLDGWAARSNKEASRELAGKIRDEKKRTDALKKFQ